VRDDRATAIINGVREAGGRVTAPRRLVIETMVALPDHHLTAADIVTAVREEEPEFYTSTVYRTLDLLVDLAVVERVHLGSGAAVYHLPDRPHRHLLCERCGEVTEAEPDLLDDLAERIHASHSFSLHPSASTLVGLCAQCQRSTTTRS
jgi:Fur family ferric uptake transcriptional regulator